MAVFGGFSPAAKYLLFLLMSASVWIPALLGVRDRKQAIRESGKPIWRAYLLASAFPVLLLAAVTVMNLIYYL